MNHLLIRLSIMLLGGLVLAACTTLQGGARGGEGYSVIHGQQAFMDWNATAQAGDRATLSDVAMQIWPGEYLLVFDGDGSIYARCFYISLTGQQVEQIRLRGMSGNEERVDVRVELDREAQRSNICSSEGHSSIRLVEILSSAE